MKRLTTQAFGAAGNAERLIAVVGTDRCVAESTTTRFGAVARAFHRRWDVVLEDIGN